MSFPRKSKTPEAERSGAGIQRTTAWAPASPPGCETLFAGAMTPRRTSPIGEFGRTARPAYPAYGTLKINPTTYPTNALAVPISAISTPLRPGDPTVRLAL